MGVNVSVGGKKRWFLPPTDQKVRGSSPLWYAKSLFLRQKYRENGLFCCIFEVKFLLKNTFWG